MNNFKCRVYDLYENKMYYNCYILGKRIVFSYVQENEDIDFTEYVDINDDNSKYFAIMRSTDIKATNKEFVYDGDIVDIEFVKGYISRGVVHIEKGTPIIKYYKPTFKRMEEPLYTLEGNIKVLGNIYETK